MKKVWIGIVNGFGGYEGDHLEVVVSESLKEVVDKIFDNFKTNNIELTDWEGRVFQREDFIHGIETVHGEGSVVIVKEVDSGSLTKLLPVD